MIIDILLFAAFVVSLSVKVKDKYVMLMVTISYVIMCILIFRAGLAIGARL